MLVVPTPTLAENIFVFRAWDRLANNDEGFSHEDSDHKHDVEPWINFHFKDWHLHCIYVDDTYMLKSDETRRQRSNDL